MLTIRLGRVGAKNNPFFRIILCEKGRDNYGDNVAVLGTYNPHTKELKVDEVKLKDWMSKGAQLSATLNNLFLDKKIISGVEKKKSRRLHTEKIVKKREENKKKEADDKVAAEAAAKAAKEAAEAAVEVAAPAEEPAVPAVEESAEKQA